MLIESVYASAPFDHKNADIILRSSDNIDFRVFTLFLSLASPFFQTLFEIPQPTDAIEGQGVKDGLLVVPMAENSKTLDILLRFCYPCILADDPDLEVLKDAVDVLEAARKYSLSVIEKKARKAITNPKILEAEPLRCFGIAYQGRLKKETVLSAKCTLTQPLIPTWFEELELITGTDFLILLSYHKRCGDAVYAMRADPSWITSHYGSSETCSWLHGRPGNDFSVCACTKSTTYKQFSYQPSQLWERPLWWKRFMDEVFTELRDRPCNETVQVTAEKTVRAVKRGSCSFCATAVAEGMRDFSSLLVRKVEEIVSQVELSLNF